MLKHTIRTGTRAYSTASSGLSSKARVAADSITGHWQGTTADGGNTKNFIDGEFVGACGSGLRRVA